MIIWGIKILFLITLIGSSIIDAMYVECLIRINNFITDSDKKIPGVAENDVEAKQVIPYYIKNLKKYIEVQNFDHFGETHNILIEYEKMHDKGDYPVELDHQLNSRAKVNFFLKQIVHSFHQDHYPFDKLTFFCFHYIKRYEETKNHLATIGKTYQKQYQDLESRLIEQHATQIDLLTKQLAKINTPKEINTEKEQAIKAYEHQLKLSIEHQEKLEEEIANLKTINENDQKSHNTLVLKLKQRIEKEKSYTTKSYTLYVTLMLFISNLFFMYKYLTK